MIKAGRNSNNLLRYFFKILVSLIIILNCSAANSQVKEPDPLLKWSSWLVLQTLPSLTFYQDNNSEHTSIRTGFGWQVVPFSFTFNTNKYLSHLNFFYLQPVKRFSGSAELYFQPEYVFGGFKKAPIKRFLFKSGVRSIFPVAQKGEYLSFSIGAGLSYQQTINNEAKYNPTIEGAVYSFFGMLGIKFNYNPGAPSKYSFGIYIKYF